MNAALKTELRRSLRRRRKALHAAAPHAGRALIDSFEAAGLALPAVASSYRAAASEIDPGPLSERLKAAGVRIALPVVVALGGPLIFRDAVAGVSGRDALGLPAPPPEAPELRPELLLIPLLGFDRQGGRIGQGGGYYDRTLAALRAQGPPVRAIGLAFSGQELDRIPLEPCDERLDGVLTESAYLSFT